jgi:hypothetical protein
MSLYSAGRGLTHRAQGRFSAWSFVQSYARTRRDQRPRANPFIDTSGCKCPTPIGRDRALMAELPGPARGDRLELAGTTQDRALPNLLLAFRGPVGAQSEQDVGRLHRLPYHARKVVVQCLEVRLVAKPGVEGFQGLSRVVLATVETAVDKRLDAAPQWVE